MDDFIPKNINENITIIKRQKSYPKYNFFSFLKILFLSLRENNFSLKKVFHYSYFSSYFSKIILNTLQKKINNSEIKAILMPYEAQNFQNKVFFEVKKKNQNIRTIGYLHSLNPFPTEQIHRPGAPDLLLVHGSSQIEILKSKLYWPHHKLKLHDSFRYRKNYNTEKHFNKIFLPLSILKSSLWLKELEKLLKNSKKGSLPVFKIQNHPAALNSDIHLKLVKRIGEILKNYDDRFSNKISNNLSICFGVTDLLERFEMGVNIYHISADPVMETYSEEMWENINVKQLSKFTFRYSLIKKGNFIMFGDKNKTLHNTLKPYIIS
tara:strand:- start:679 stop:1644 length:966 start_codon:yes stop_codon:yes gene_type:complete